jgi:hypothetical protein
MDPAQINLPATRELALNTSKSISIVKDKVIGSRLGQGIATSNPISVKVATARAVAMSPCR